MDFNLNLQNLPWVWIGLALLFFLFLLTFFLLLKKKKEEGFLRRGMNLTVFLVTVPREFEKETSSFQAKGAALEEYFKTVEQFYSSLAGIKEPSFIRKILLGKPALVFEIAVHQIGEEICFYVACPRPIAETIEKQILGFWPKARVQPSADFNIFNPTGHSTGAQAYLTKSQILPIKFAREFGADPLSTITSVFTKLERETEGAAIQFLIRPSSRGVKSSGQKIIKLLQEGAKLEDAVREVEVTRGVGGISRTIITSFLDALFPKKKVLTSQTGSKPETFSLGASPVQQEIIATISKKASQPVFDVNLRILSSAPDKERAEMILEELQAVFQQFNLPLFNQIGFKKLSGGHLKKLFYRFSFRIFNEGKIMLLSPGELAGLFHFPSPYLLTPHIKWLKAKQAPAPDNLPERGIIIGENLFRGVKKRVRLLEGDRRRHFYIIGQTGTGKSVLIQEMMRQDIEEGKGVCLIDPHGDLAERMLGLIPINRVEDVIYFNPSDVERPLGLNMLEYDLKFPEAKTFVVNELLEIFEKLYNLKVHGFGGPIFEQYMRNSLLLIMEHPQSGNTLIEVPRVLSDTNFRKYKLSRCRNPVVKNFWELEAEKAGGEAALANMVPYITSKMNIFIANDMVRPIISQEQSAFNFREIMDNRKILIVNLCKGKLGEINSYLLGMIIIGKILIAAFSRADIPEEERHDFYVYIDEFHNVTTKTIAAALAEARKYCLNLIFAHQYIGQLDEETRKAIFGNIGTILAFRTGPDDAKYLVTQFEPVFNEEDLINFDNYNTAFRPLIRGQTSMPFSIITVPPTRENPETREFVKKYSRTRYGRNRALIEAELHQRLQQTF